MPSRRWISLHFGLMLGVTMLSPDLLRTAFAQDDDLGRSGEADFHMYCADCHGDDGRGDGPRAFGLSVPPPSLTRLAKRNGGTFPRDRVTALIDGRESVAAHGSREMPAWGDWFKIEAEEGLGGAEGDENSIKRRINNLVDYLVTIQE